jgi:predicted ATP-binding protein involved in virulence
MFGVIHSYLKALYPTVADGSLLQQRAIVFIDEIDAHLHPAWQRKIVALLRQEFPNIQFVLTAHSPLVVAGCLDGEVAVLRRTATNKFTLHQFEHDFIGWDAGHIYHTVFDVEERDESFKTYSMLYADRDRIEAEVKKLGTKTNRSADDEQALKELRDKLYYIDKTQEAQNRNAGTRELEIENRRLRTQVERLSPAPTGTPEGGHHDRLR